MIRKTIYNLIKFPLIVIFIKTPFIIILKKRFRSHRFRKPSIFWFILDLLFQREYFNKLSDNKELRELTDSTLNNGEGSKWANYYYDIHFKTLEELQKRKIGCMNMSEAVPIFQKMINFIKSKNFYEHKDTYIIQLGSSSGRDLEFFLNLFPRINYISTDINDEILNFQKKNYNYKNLKYFKCHGEDFDKCIENFNLSDKKIILFSVDTLQYLNNFFFKKLFNKNKKI